MSVAQGANIANHLSAMAARQPDKPALYVPRGRAGDDYACVTYRELDQRSDAIARGLEAIGVSKGVRTTLMVKPSVELFALTFAIFKVGAVPVMVDPGIGLANLKACLGRAEPEAFIGIPQAHAARIILGWARPTLKTFVTVGRRWFWGGHTLDQIEALGQQAGGGAYKTDTHLDDLAAILFTSGSTGPPKGAVYCHENFQAQIDGLKAMFDFEPGVDVDLPTFPLFALFDPALGMTTVIPRMDATKPASVNPREIIGPIHKFNVTTMFGSPALLNTVGRYGEQHQIKLPSIRRVISAGAPLPDHVMRRFHAMLGDDARIFPPYGATESLPVAMLGSDEILGETWARTEEGDGVCVGRPVETIDVKIIRISDDPIDAWDEGLALPQGEIGEITVRGPMVTRRYHNDPDNTAKAKIATDDPRRPWHRMGDLGYFDEQGRLWVCGRKSHRVVTDAGTRFTVPCEAVFNAHPKVYRTALVGVPVKGQVEPVLCVELERDALGASQDTIRTELQEMGARHKRTQGIERIVFHKGFPVDIRHNAKIRREDLSVWARKVVS